MKIRIRGNTLRYRLSKTEVKILAEEGRLEERIEFVNDSLIYSIEQSTSENLSADFLHNKIKLFVPEQMLQSWDATEQVGIDYHMPLPNGNTLYILLEKDFKCIDAAVTEDQSDNFENPHLSC